MNLMKGKVGLIMGVANTSSIAYGIAKNIHEQGGKIIYTYAIEQLQGRVEKVAEETDSDMVIKCNVGEEKEVENLFKTIKEQVGKIDFIVHAIAFSDKNELKGNFFDTSRENFLNSMDISCFSLINICKHAFPILNEGGSIVTLTYLGAERVLPNYNVMGVAKAALEASVRYLAEDLGKHRIRINAISAGPIKTLAASGIGDFRYILKWNELNSPLRRSVTIDEVGKSALYLLSDMASGVTGEIHYVDSGYNTVGMKAIDAPDISL